MDGETAQPIVEAVTLRRVWRRVPAKVLETRPSKPVDHGLENQALIRLARTMSREPTRLLQHFADLLVDLGGACFAGIAFPEDDPDGGPGWAWRATAGSGPPPVCLPHDHQAVVAGGTASLFQGSESEALATPFRAQGQLTGVVWAVAIGDGGRFDAEDRRRLECLTLFVADAYQAATAQAELRASEARFRALVTCPGPIVFRATVEGMILDAPGWESLTGQDKAGYRGWGWLKIVHPEDRQLCIDTWSLSLKSGEPAYMDYRLRDVRGAWRWVAGFGVPVRGVDGRIVEWVGTVTDIHELRQAREALIENESFHRYAAEAGRTGSWYMRLDTEEVELSPLVAELFGLPAEKVHWSADTWERYVLEADRRALRRAMQAAIDAGEPFDVEFRVRRPDGAVRWLYSRGGLARNPAGEPLRLHGATVDLTERKQTEARRLAIVEVADRLRDLDDVDDISHAAAEIIGRTLDLTWIALGVLDEGDRAVDVRYSWCASGAGDAPSRIALSTFAEQAAEIDRGEPVVIAATDASGARIVYRPTTTVSGLPWVLVAVADSARDWSSDDLAFVRDAVERTRAAIERKLAEKDLRALTRNLEREVEARTAEWSRLWRNSRDLLLVIDRNGVLRAVNPALTTILGWEPDAVVGRPIAELVHPDDHAGSRAALSLIGDENPPSYENRYRHRDGGYRWFSWVATPEDGLIYATGRHITAEKEAQAALEESQTRFRHFFETSYQLRALVSLDGALLEVNATALAAAGVRREDVVGKPLWRTPWFTRTPGIPEAVRAAVPRVAAGEIRREDIYLNLPAAGWRWLDFTLRPLHDPRGEAVGIVLEAIDVTEHREVEAALRQSQKLEAMGQLTGGVAHDFNNLLTPIIGGLDVLRRRAAGGPREQRLIDGALQSAERARVLVRRLLAFARRQPLRTGPVDIAALIQGMADLVASTAGPQVRIVAEAAADLPPAQADANQLEMAVLNLSVNARDAMPEGGVLRIAAGRDTVGEGHASSLPPGDYIRLTVADTGVGMDEATRARAIEPFFSTKGQGRGTGLGLSMAHGLASQLGGALTIVSAPSQGAEVNLWLPISTEPPSRDMPVNASGPTADTPLAGLALLVDDEALARAATADMLADLGLEVIQAASGGEALKLLERESRIGVLITDHLMPGMTGAELANAARRRRPDLLILVVTGYADALPGDLARLDKPFRQAELAAALAAVTAAA